MSLARQTELMEIDRGQYGGLFISDTDAHTGNFGKIIVISNCSITTVGNITLTAASLPAGTIVYGIFTSITLGSGSVLANNSQ